LNFLFNTDILAEKNAYELPLKLLHFLSAILNSSVLIDVGVDKFDAMQILKEKPFCIHNINIDMIVGKKSLDQKVNMPF